jgi:multidrug efflux pump
MRKFIGFFLDHISIVTLILVGIVLIGWSTYMSLARESFPQIKIPYIIVQTIYRGVAPSDMETLVTKPLETKIKSISGIKKVSSTSGESFSGIFIEFNPDVDIESALQKVRDKVSTAKAELPTDIEDRGQGN